MVLSVPAALRMAAGAFLLLSLLTPSVSAQLPPEVTNNFSSAVLVNVECQDTFLEPTYAGVDIVTCTVRDLSRDCLCAPGTGSGTSVRQHYVDFQIVPAPGFENISGWQSDLPTRVQLDGSETATFDVNIKATPAITTQDYKWQLIATVDSASGYRSTSVLNFTAEVQNYDFAQLSWADPATAAQKVGQDDVVTYSILIQNTGVYPDSYRISVDSKPDIKVSPPGNVYVPAGESRVVNISVLTPHGKPYEVGRSETVSIKVASLTGSGVYSLTGSLGIRGAYIPVYWIPLFLVGMVSAAVVARGSREQAELRRLEKGRPRRVDLTPRQEVLLAELKRSDPDAYKEKRSALDNVYKERTVDYRDHRKERDQKDKEEAKIAHAEYVEQKKARKAQRAEEKRAAKLAKVQAKRDGKLLKKKEKELAKTRKVLEKRKAKADKIAAKVAAKQAKVDAKQAERDAKDAAKAEKAAQKAAKAAAKAEKKQPKE